MTSPLFLRGEGEHEDSCTSCETEPEAAVTRSFPSLCHTLNILRSTQRQRAEPARCLPRSPCPQAQPPRTPLGSQAGTAAPPSPGTAAGARMPGAGRRRRARTPLGRGRPGPEQRPRGEERPPRAAASPRQLRSPREAPPGPGRAEPGRGREGSRGRSEAAPSPRPYLCRDIFRPPAARPGLPGPPCPAMAARRRLRTRGPMGRARPRPSPGRQRRLAAPAALPGGNGPASAGG